MYFAVSVCAQPAPRRPAGCRGCRRRRRVRRQSRIAQADPSGPTRSAPAGSRPGLVERPPSRPGQLRVPGQLRHHHPGRSSQSGHESPYLRIASSVSSWLYARPCPPRPASPSAVRSREACGRTRPGNSRRTLEDCPAPPCGRKSAVSGRPTCSGSRGRAGRKPTTGLPSPRVG